VSQPEAERQALTPLHLVLVEPEIPGNTGSIARVCAGARLPLHLVGKLGFSLDDRYLKRAGLDYWPSVPLRVHDTWEDFRLAHGSNRVWLFTRKAEQVYWDVRYEPGDALVFGCETRGLPASLLERHGDTLVRIPTTHHIRSLNLANAASLAAYEALRQLRWDPQSYDKD
jgi:tRNA (cytidine/uridine-2'-O-)-methyltransferase